MTAAGDVVHLQQGPLVPPLLAIAVEGADGLDVVFACVRHQWASHPLPAEAPEARVSVVRCPRCLADLEAVAGEARYRAIHAAVLA